jgi:hypothetical protein
MKRILVYATLVAVLALAFPASALAAGPEDGRIVLGGTFTLGSGESLNGDLVVVGGNVTLEAGSTVNGNVFMLGGNGSAAGEIRGDVSMIGGNLALLATAVVHGNVNTFGGNIDRTPGSQIEGQVFSGQSYQGPSINLPPFRGVYGPDFTGFNLFNTMTDILWGILRTLLMAGLAVLVVMFFAEPTARAAKAILDAPVITGAIGLLTVIVFPVLFVLLAITLCLLPVGIVGAFIFAVAWVFGSIAVGLEVGLRLANVFNWHPHPAAAAGLGTLFLQLVGLVPCFGGLVAFVVGILGVGAILLTRFGSRAYIKPSASTPVPSALPPAS